MKKQQKGHKSHNFISFSKILHLSRDYGFLSSYRDQSFTTSFFYDRPIRRCLMKKTRQYYQNTTKEEISKENKKMNAKFVK